MSDSEQRRLERCQELSGCARLLSVYNGEVQSTNRARRLNPPTLLKRERAYFPTRLRACRRFFKRPRGADTLAVTAGARLDHKSAA